MRFMTERQERLLEDEKNELWKLRAERNSLEARERAEAAKKERDAWASRTWEQEGDGTDVFSLKIDGGRLLKIGGRYFFQQLPPRSYVIGSAPYTHQMHVTGVYGYPILLT